MLQMNLFNYLKILCLLKFNYFYTELIKKARFLNTFGRLINNFIKITFPGVGAMTVKNKRKMVVKKPKKVKVERKISDWQHIIEAARQKETNWKFLREEFRGELVFGDD